MAKAYSDDLRVRLLEACAAGGRSQRELAATFRVSLGYVEKIRGQFLRTGSKLRPLQRRHGPLSRVGPGQRTQMCAWVREQPDLTVAELQERLRKAGAPVCWTRTWQVLRELGLGRKKNPACG